FFFSSRRRHTRFSRDWSSDVCSSDLITKARPDTPPPYGGSPYTLLIGGKGYGAPSQPGKIHDIYAFNLMGDGKNLVLIEAPVVNCRIVNGTYTGPADQPITFNIPLAETKNVTYAELFKINPN